MLVVSTGFMVNPSLYAKVPYDPIKDFAPVTLVAASPNVISVHPSLPAKTVKELIALVKANPGKYSYAQPSHRLDPASRRANCSSSVRARSRHGAVQQRGARDQLDASAGHTPIAFTALPPAITNIREGKLRGLAVLAAQAHRRAARCADHRRRPACPTRKPIR